MLAIVAAVITWLSLMTPAQAAVSCADCRIYATALANRLQREQARKVHADDPDLVGAPGPGRRPRHGLIDGQINYALDFVCVELPPSIPKDKVEECKGLIEARKPVLEDFIFNHGPDRLSVFLCTELARLCDYHTIVDSGEL